MNAVLSSVSLPVPSRKAGTAMGLLAVMVLGLMAAFPTYALDLVGSHDLGHDRQPGRDLAAHEEAPAGVRHAKPDSVDGAGDLHRRGHRRGE